MSADELGLGTDEFVERVLTLVEADGSAAPAKGAERRRVALERRNKAMAATTKAAQSVAASDAPASLKSAKLAVQNARRREADAVYRAAIAEGDDSWKVVIREAAERVGMTVVIPPRPGEVEHYGAKGELVGRSKRVGNKITHYTADGRAVGTTTLSGRKLFSRSVTGAATGKHIIRN
ncbi:hypothetical protein D3869_08920 [Azospirillum brasilense]|uniref:Uncharacterized protein n=1 Tax=Azospirillum brasilense TaxID=192 RepID=A0A4D8QVZ2_AZOBR|nr:hypothetical protein [Azospirillum brasilense]QCO15335.1 hypothetical protein D3869_08920 [Azospirillum brasilense]